MVTIKLEEYEAQNLIVKKDMVVDDTVLFSQGNKTILLYANDIEEIFTLVNELGEYQDLSYEYFNEYFKLEK